MQLPKNALYRTKLGAMYCADSLEFMRALPDACIDCVLTSPPYALHFKKEYGNPSQTEYVAWLLPFAREIKRILKPTGSFVLNIGGVWMPGAPVRSLYHFRLLLTLCDEVGFRLAQECFWYNPAKMPVPAEWVNVRRERIKDSVEYVFWLSPSEHPKANNRHVLTPYSRDMLRLIARGIRPTTRPSGHVITEKFSNGSGGAIPSNLLQAGNNESNSAYMKLCKLFGKKVHPARFPAALPKFFIALLTDSGDCVLDPFAGSNTTGAVAEELGRQWIAIELDRQYAQDSGIRFDRERIAALAVLDAGGQTSLFTQNSASRKSLHIASRASPDSAKRQREFVLR